MKIATGKRMTQMRLALGFDYCYAFADDLRIGRDALSSYENGTRTMPWELMRTLKMRYGVSTDWLLHGDEASMPIDLMRRIRAVEQIDGWDQPKRGPRRNRKEIDALL